MLSKPAGEFKIQHLKFKIIYLSISGITKSSVPIIATRSPNLLPLAIWSSAERFEKPGERNLIR
jgi:hypothetical protein